MSVNHKRSICVVAPYEPSLSETFIRAHIEQLPARTFLVHGWRPRVGENTILSFPELVLHRTRRMLLGESLNKEVTSAYLRAFSQNGVEAVLAEYGETGVQVMRACKQMNLPLIVHFHGYDASVYSVLEQNRDSYKEMFESAAAIIAVSRAMEQKLVSLGAPASKIHYNPCGIDCTRFAGARPAEAPPLFVAVGRFVEKKAPQLTIKAFKKVHDSLPQARLRMIGDGPLLEESKNLSTDLGLGEAVTFFGAQPPEVVQAEMRAARCFVQHSIQAPSGDSEGTPVCLLEGGATGLPVVSTRHAGIPDVVIHGETGFLVDERDVEGMAEYMLRIGRDPELAAKFGVAARERIRENFSIEKSISRLWRIIESSLNGAHATASPTFSKSS